MTSGRCAHRSESRLVCGQSVNNQKWCNAAIPRLGFKIDQFVLRIMDEKPSVRSEPLLDGDDALDLTGMPVPFTGAHFQNGGPDRDRTGAERFCRTSPLPTWLHSRAQQKARSGTCPIKAVGQKLFDLATTKCGSEYVWSLMSFHAKFKPTN
jgi:hypothetical protein